MLTSLKNIVIKLVKFISSLIINFFMHLKKMLSNPRRIKVQDKKSKIIKVKERVVVERIRC